MEAFSYNEPRHINVFFLLCVKSSRQICRFLKLFSVLTKDSSYYSPCPASASSPYWLEGVETFLAYTSQTAAMKNWRKWAVETDCLA
jgi:hypothetical protein